MAEFPIAQCAWPTAGEYCSSRIPTLHQWSRHSTEALVGAVTGSLSASVTALLGRFDTDGHLQYAGRTTVLNTAVRQALGATLRPGHVDHPWTGWSFSAGWGTQEQLHIRLAQLLIVAEVAVDVSVDSAGRWRRPVRLLRIRAEMHPMQVPKFGEPDQPPA
jgi:hypothetical protein